MRLKWLASLTGGTSYDPADPAAQELLSRVTASANAQWSRLVTNSARTFLWSDLTSTANSSEITTAYNRILAMAMAWATRGGPFYSNALLGTDIVGTLDWMYANRYNEDKSEYDNWWDWEIGAPMALNDICVLMYDRLTAAQLANYMNAVNEFPLPAPISLGRTGSGNPRRAIRGAGQGCFQLCRGRGWIHSLFFPTYEQRWFLC
jgi:hyaluronate lyase